MTVGVPVKGRLREPAIGLLHDAGLAPELASERNLSLTCRGAPVDVLLVRAEDVPGYVEEGAIDCGITGADVVRERGADVDTILALGFGACTLQAAVPVGSCAQTLEDLSGARIATSYPRLAEKVLSERGVDAHLVVMRGSVEVAPRLDLADAIVDLVSSGHTLRTNGLRSVDVLFASEAVLITQKAGNDAAAQFANLLRAVVDARAARYLMLNAPSDALDEICALMPASRSPTVLPLAAAGMVAVHALVPAADVWRLLPRLEAAGASSILLVAPERLLA